MSWPCTCVCACASVAAKAGGRREVLRQTQVSGWWRCGKGRGGTKRRCFVRRARVTHLRFAGISRFLAGGSTVRLCAVACDRGTVHTARRRRKRRRRRWLVGQYQPEFIRCSAALGRRRPAMRYVSVFLNLASVATYFRCNPISTEDDLHNRYAGHVVLFVTGIFRMAHQQSHWLETGNV